MTAKKGEILVPEPGAPEQPETLMGLVRTAVERGAAVEVEVFERLVALQERVEARQAEMAMARALAAFQAECPPIPRTKAISYDKGGTKKLITKFAPLDEIVPLIRPHLSEHGLTFVHDTHSSGQHPNQSIRVTCVLQHSDGAIRTATFEGPIDASGGKNPIQMVASARSYGRRYTLMDVLGLVTEEDTDGNATPVEDAERVSDEQFAFLMKLKDEVGADAARYCAFLGVETMRDIPAARYDEAVRELERKRVRR